MPPRPRALPEGDGEHAHRTMHGSSSYSSHQRCSGPHAAHAPPHGRRETRQQQLRHMRWSYSLQDIPTKVKRALNDINKGYTLRLTSAIGLTFAVGYAVYWGVLVRSQEGRPLAQRWSWCSSAVPITLIEKKKDGSTGAMYVYRFALPNSYDYAGYTPVSSVRMTSGPVGNLSSLTRWYTPISHPRERGTISFAIKDCDPGRMSARLRSLELGDVVYLGRWMKEFAYKPNAHGELGLVCSTSGASVALQLMNVLAHDRQDHTKLRLLYCHHTATGIPFKHSLFDPYIAASGGKISVKYAVHSFVRQTSDADLRPYENVFVGNLDTATLRAALPPPVCSVSDPSNDGAVRSVRSKILVCGPQSMLVFLCGRVSPVWSWTYWQGPFFKYRGFLKDMHYDRQQVYKFGVSTHFLALH